MSHLYECDSYLLKSHVHTFCIIYWQGTLHGIDISPMSEVEMECHVEDVVDLSDDEDDDFLVIAIHICSRLVEV